MARPTSEWNVLTLVSAPQPPPERMVILLTCSGGPGLRRQKGRVEIGETGGIGEIGVSRVSPCIVFGTQGT